MKFRVYLRIIFLYISIFLKVKKKKIIGFSNLKTYLINFFFYKNVLII